MTLHPIGESVERNSQNIILQQGLRIEAFSKFCLLVQRAQEILKKDLNDIDSGRITASESLRLERQMRTDPSEPRGPRGPEGQS